MTLRTKLHPWNVGGIGGSNNNINQRQQSLQMKSIKFNTDNFKSIAESLDAADGKVDGKIDKSIWNAYAKQVGGNQIKNYITTENAMKAIEKYYNKDNDKVIQNGASVMSMDEAGKLFENKGGSFYEDATVEEKNLVKQIISQNPHILDDIKDPKNDNSLEQFGQFLKKEFYFAGERIDILYTDGAGHVDSIYINDNFVAGLEYEDTNGNYVADYEDEEW